MAATGAAGSGGGVKGGCGARAGAEVAQTAWDAGHRAQFAGDVEQTAGEQANVEHVAPLPFLLGSEEVEQQRAQTGGVQYRGDISTARAVPRATAAMREHNKSMGVVGHG